MQGLADNFVTIVVVELRKWFSNLSGTTKTSIGCALALMWILILISAGDESTSTDTIDIFKVEDTIDMSYMPEETIDDGPSGYMNNGTMYLSDFAETLSGSMGTIIIIMMVFGGVAAILYAMTSVIIGPRLR